MPTLSIILQGKLFSRTATWDEIFSMRDLLRRYCVFDRSKTAWVPRKSSFTCEKDIEDFTNIVRMIWGSEASKYAEEIAHRYYIEERTIYLYEDNGEVILKIPRMDYDLFNSLRNALSCPYYRTDAQGQLYVYTMRFYQYDSDRKIFKTYPFVYRVLEEWCRKYNYRFQCSIDFPDYTIEIKKDNINLFDFQREALKKWAENGFWGTLVIPTGGGKTFVAMKAIRYLRKSTLICVTTVELAKQWKERLKKYLGVDVGMLGAGYHDIRNVTVAIYNSAVKHIDKLKRKFSFVIFDEGHHVPAETFKQVAMQIYAKYRMVLSATPERADRNEVLIYYCCGEPVYSISYFELARQGIVAPLKIKRIYVELDDDEYEKYMEVQRDESLSEPQRITRLKKIAFMARAKYRVLEKLIQSLDRSKKVLVFCQYIEQARKSCEIIRKYEPRTALVTGNVANYERKQIFDRFRKGDIRVIVTTTVLDEGIDVPDADVAIIMSGTGQRRQMIQRVGRVIRWRPGKIAEVYEIVTSETIEEYLADRRDIRRMFDADKMRDLILVLRAIKYNPDIKPVIEKYVKFLEGRIKLTDNELRHIHSQIREFINLYLRGVRI